MAKGTGFTHALSLSAGIILIGLPAAAIPLLDTKDTAQPPTATETLGSQPHQAERQLPPDIKDALRSGRTLIGMRMR